MTIPTSVAAAACTAALVLSAAAGAATAARGQQATRPTIGKGTIAVSKVKALPKPKPKPKPKQGVAAGVLVILPFIATSSDSSLGGVENCAAYTGCTEEEYCVIWGVKCDLVPQPVGTRRSQEYPGS
jgi:hypothetical protein